MSRTSGRKLLLQANVSYTQEDVNCLRFHPDENICSEGALTYIIRILYEEDVDDVNDKPLFSTDGLCPAWVHSCSQKRILQ